MTLRTSLVLATPAFMPVLEVARRAEAGGFHRVWTTETPGRDAMVRALTIAHHTRSIQVATGIAYAFTRAPLAMAATASDIQVASGGRFSLGIGAGTQGMRTRWYGIDDFDHPATRLAEYAQLMRAAWDASTEFRHEGRFYRGSFDQLDGQRPPVPLWGSGVNPTMLTVAARHFDGVALHPLASSTAYLDRVARPAFEAGRPAGGAPAELAAWRLTSIDPDAGHARERARRSLAFYFSTPSYGGVATETGWGDIAAGIRAAYREHGPQWTDLGRLVPRAMLDEFCLAGTPAEVRDGWTSLRTEYESRGVTEIVFQTASSGGDAEDTLDNLNRIVDVLAPHRTADGGTT